MLFILTTEPDVKWHEGAWWLLYEINYQKVYKIAFTITRDAGLAEDIVQEVFCNAFSSMDTLKDKNKFSKWVCVIAANISNNMLRQKIRHRNRNVSLYDKDGNIQSCVVELTALNNPEEAYEDKEEIQEILDCIDGLGTEEKQIIYLKFYEDFTYAQIAEQIQMKESAINNESVAG
jgi:RNA polymerase sigma-70 factor (ECF subfamily)